MNNFFIKETYVFDASKFKVGYPYKIQCDDVESYELFIKIDKLGNAVFRTYDGKEHTVFLADYISDKVTIEGPLTITFDACSITIADPDSGSIGIDPNKVPLTVDDAPLPNEPCVDNIRGHQLTDLERTAMDWAEEERASAYETFDEIVEAVETHRQSTLNDEEKKTCLMKLEKAVEDCKRATGIVKETRTILDEINGYPHTFVEVNQDSTNPYVSHTPSLEERDQFFREISEMAEIVSNGKISNEEDQK